MQSILQFLTFITADLIIFLPSFHYQSFEYISGVLTFPIGTTYIVIQIRHWIALYFLFCGLHFATTLRVLKPVLCFHMTSFNYGAKGVRNAELNCRCHQSNIIPDNSFSVNITQCVTFGYQFFLFYFLCLCIQG